MRFSLIPREMRFFDMIDEQTATIARAAKLFCDLLSNYDNLTERARALKDEEVNCDKIVERIITALDQSFITPFDREDIHTLTCNLDDILDHMEETAHRFSVFGLPKPAPEALTLAQHVAACCGHLQTAIRMLRNLHDADEIYKHLREVGRLENEADTIYRAMDVSLFTSAGNDMIALIKWREIYWWLEATVDACKAAAHVVSEIVIKGS